MAPIIAGVNRRSPARLLAPAALVAAVVALFAVVASPSGDKTAEPDAAATPATIATATPERDRERRERSGETYTVQAGDTPLSIAEQLGVDVDALLAANPDADPNALTVGAELELP